MTMHPRGRCPTCNGNVAVDARGRAMAHGRKARPATGLDGRPFRSTDYGCHGWGQPALPLEEK